SSGRVAGFCSGAAFAEEPGVRAGARLGHDARTPLVGLAVAVVVVVGGAGVGGRGRDRARAPALLAARLRPGGALAEQAAVAARARVAVHARTLLVDDAV